MRRLTRALLPPALAPTLAEPFRVRGPGGGLAGGDGAARPAPEGAP
jgi:hypothetical protein